MEALAPLAPEHEAPRHTTSVAGGVVAVTGEVDAAGAILMWTLSGETDLTLMTEAWKAHGFDAGLLPKPPSDRLVLQRAMHSLATRNRFVRRVSMQGFSGWVLVAAGVSIKVLVAAGVSINDAEDLDFAALASVRFDGAGGLDVRTKDDGVRDEILTAFAARAGKLEAADISSWLIDAALRMDAVPLRQSGGVYFVPRASLDGLEKVVACLRAASGHAIYRIPAMTSDEAVAAILAGVTAEAEAEAEGMEAELEAAQLGERGYQTRIHRTDRIEQKVARYEALLGSSLDAIRERLERLRGNLTVAMLTKPAAATP